MTSSPHGPYALGCTRATMVGTEGCQTVRWSKSQKADPTSDCSLQPRLHEVGIASNRESAGRGEYVPRPLYTPPVTPWSW